MVIIMRVAIVSNFLNHHQIPICEDFIRLSDEFCFVTTESTGTQGYQLNTEREYVLHYDFEQDRERVIEAVLSADIAIMGACPNELIEMRAKSGKLTYIYSERFFKNSTLRRFIPTTRRKIYNRVLKYKKYDNVFVLAASAFLSYDLSLLHFPVSKVYKWGYFPKFIEYPDIAEVISKKKRNSLLWVGRFLSWKHPEYAVGLAEKLRDSGADFELNMIGDGECYNEIKKLIEKYELQNQVHLLGSQSTKTVREYMENSELFIFTSDKHECWGAVLNEAMNSGCAVVASDAIGSAPWLIKDNENGALFRSGNIDDLYSKVKNLLENESLRQNIGVNAYENIRKYWNHTVAAERLLELQNAPVKYECGPLSSAE